MSLSIQLRIFRYDPSKDQAPWYGDYTIPWKDGLLLLQAIRYVRDHLDETLAYRDYCCGCGWCTSCLMMVDGKGTRTCSRPLKAGECVLVEPMKGFPLVKDLVVDFGVTVTTVDGTFRKSTGTVLRKTAQSE